MSFVLSRIAWMNILRRDGRSPRTPEQQLRVRTRRAFLTLGVTATAGYGAWRWLQNRPPDGSIPEPFRRMLRFNEKLEQDFFSEHRTASVFPDNLVQPIRTNGDIGL